MEAAPDRYRYILSLPIVGEPGVKWTYCGGATALLGRLIAKGTGEKLTDYARRVLFDPLGLGPDRMVDRPQRRAARRLGRAPASARSVARRPDGAGERRLAGQADRPGGVAQAVDNSRSHHRGPAPLRLALVSRRASRRRAASRPNATISAIGWGGQRLFLVPALDLAVAMNAGNYRRPILEQRRIGAALITDLVLPGLS